MRHADYVARQSQSNSATSALTASWRRSLFKHGLDPADARPPERLTFEELSQRRQAMDPFLRVAAPQLDQLFNLVGLSGCNVMLTDADGVVLDQRVNGADAEQVRDWGLWLADDEEELIGMGVFHIEDDVRRYITEKLRSLPQAIRKRAAERRRALRG